jgi:hypothetical protein
MGTNPFPGLAEAIAELLKRKNIMTTELEPSEDSPKPSDELQQNSANDHAKVQHGAASPGTGRNPGQRQVRQAD